MFKFLTRWFKSAPVTHIVVAQPDNHYRAAYILGPYSERTAHWVAFLVIRWESRKNRNPEVIIASRFHTIMRGDEVLRPADPPERP